MLMESEQLLPPLAHTPALPGGDDQSTEDTGVPGSIPELQVLEVAEPKVAEPKVAEPKVPDDGGWSTVAGLPPPANEGTLVLQAIDAWADGVAEQAQRCGHTLDAERVKVILQENNAFSAPRTLLGLATAAATTAVALRTADHEGVDADEVENEGNDNTHTVIPDAFDAPLTPPRSPKGQAELSETTEHESIDSEITGEKNGKTGSKSRSTGTGGQNKDTSDNSDKNDKNQKISKKEKRDGQRWIDTRETMWIQASDEGWTGREASISRILEQHQLASEQEPEAVELAALRDKLREMTTQELQHEELNRPVHQPATRAGHSETFSFHSEVYKVTPLALGETSNATTLQPEPGELELARRACPRLNLLSPSQVVQLLHMTHPEELGALLGTMSSIDRLVYRQPPSASSCCRFKPAVEVVAVQQLTVDGQSVTLPLVRPHPSTHFAVPAESSGETPPQAQWIECLFNLIAESQQRQLERLRAHWPTQGRFLCEFLQPENEDGPETTADRCCLQVLLLALNLKVSDILRLEAELTVSGLELETTIDAETSIPRLSDVTLWEEAEALVKSELAAARGMRIKQIAENDPQALEGTTLLQSLIVRLIGLRCTLSRRDVADVVRFREVAQGEIEVSMLVQAPTSTGTTKTTWHGCLYGWELKLVSQPLVTTTQIPSVLRTIFTGLSDVGSLDDVLPDRTLQLPTTIIEGPMGSGKCESLMDACTAVFGISFKMVNDDDRTHFDSTELAVSARALAHFPFVLILEDANCVSRSALEDAMSQPHLVPSGSVHGFSGLVCAFDAELESALHSKVSMKRIISRNDTVAMAIRPPDDKLLEYTYFSAFSCCSDAVAFIAAAYFSCDAGRQICPVRALKRIKTMLSASVYSTDDDSSILEVFRWLGREVSFAELEPRLDLTGCASADIIGAWRQLESKVGKLAAHRRYHRRLLASVYSKGAHTKGVDMVIRDHVLSGRRFHAADVVAVLCNFPELVSKHELMRLKPSERAVAVDWPGTRSVRSEYLEVHISGSGEGYHGPGALWAGKSAWDLLSRPVQTEPHRKLLPMVLAVNGALTTLELLPAIMHSAGAKELLTLPSTQAVLAAKWQLLRLYWLLEFASFVVLFFMFISYALVEATVARGVLLTFACVFTLPLFWVEWRQHDAIQAMRGVGASMARRDQIDRAGSTLLVRHLQHFTMHKIMDLTGLILVWVSAVAALATGANDDTSTDASSVAQASLGWKSSSLVAFTVLSLCIKLVSFLKVNTAMGFLVSVISTCVWSMRQFLVFMVLVIVVSGTTFQLQFAPLVMSAPADATGALSESTIGGPGAHGLMNSIWTSFRFTILGEFDPELFSAGGVAVVVVFVLVTLLVNVVMLNILIAIVSDAFKEQHDQAEYLAAKLIAEIIFGIDCCFPRKRRAAFQSSDDEVAEGEEYHNEIQYEHHRFDKMFAWEFKEQLKCPMSQATLHVLSARASAAHAQATAAAKKLADQVAMQEQEEQAADRAQRQEHQEWERKQEQIQKSHKEHCKALTVAHNQTKAELQAAKAAREHAAQEAKQALEAARAEAQEHIGRAVTEATAKTQSRLGLELERLSKELDAHKRAAEASAGEAAALEEAHAAAHNEIQELKTASEQSLIDASKELQVAQELAAEELARVEAEAETLKAEKAELEEIAAQLKAEVEASAVRGRRKKKK